jgi:hypothetical protein
MLKWDFRCSKSLYSNTFLQAQTLRLQNFTPKTHPANGFSGPWQRTYIEVRAELGGQTAQ